MSIAKEIELTGNWTSQTEHLVFNPEGEYQKGQESGTYLIELNENIGSLVLDLIPHDNEESQYTFSIVLNKEGTFLTLYQPLHVAQGIYKKVD